MLGNRPVPYVGSATGARSDPQILLKTPKRVPPVLAPEVNASRATTCPRRTATADRRHGSRELHVGRGTDCRRTPAEAGDPGLAADHQAVHAAGRAPRTGARSQTWSTFVSNHARS